MPRRASSLAFQARQQLGVSPQMPIPDLFKVIQLSGIGVIRYTFKFSGRTSALLCRHREDFFVVLDSSRTLGHQRFSAAHELGHYMAHRDRLYFSCDPSEPPGNGDSAIERFADQFAIEFLMPKLAVDWWLENHALSPQAPSLHDVLRLEQAFGVSHKATLFQLKTFSVISARQFEDWTEKSPVQLAKRWGLPTDLYEPDQALQVPDEYSAFWVDAYELGRVTYQKLTAALLRIGMQAETLDLKHPTKVGDVI